MGLFDLFKQKSTKTTSANTQSNKTAYMSDFEEHLGLVLNILLDFKDAYLQVGDRLFLSFVIDRKKTDYSDTYYTYDYYFKMTVYVSDWWDSIMIRHKDIGDTFENVFDIKEDENTFLCKSVSVGSSTCCSLDWDKINSKLQKFLDEYESEHPGVIFDRSNGGAGIKFGDWK